MIFEKNECHSCRFMLCCLIYIIFHLTSSHKRALIKCSVSVTACACVCVDDCVVNISSSVGQHLDSSSTDEGNTKPTTTTSHPMCTLSIWFRSSSLRPVRLLSFCFVVFFYNSKFFRAFMITFNKSGEKKTLTSKTETGFICNKNRRAERPHTMLYMRLSTSSSSYSSFSLNSANKRKQASPVSGWIFCTSCWYYGAAVGDSAVAIKSTVSRWS